MQDLAHTLTQILVSCTYTIPYTSRHVRCGVGVGDKGVGGTKTSVPLFMLIKEAVLFLCSTNKPEHSQLETHTLAHHTATFS